MSSCKKAFAAQFPAAVMSAVLFLSVLVLPAVAMAKEESISGRVTTDATDSGDKEMRYLSGVTMTLRNVQSGAALATAPTDKEGRYEFKKLADGTYTVTPQKTNFAFTPASRAVTIEDEDVKKQDFIALPTHSISGRVATDFGGASGLIALAGATLALGGAASTSTTADGNGNYTFAGLVTGNYTITPRYAFQAIRAESGTITSAAFTPASRSVIVNKSNIAGQDFNGFNACASLNGFCPTGSYFNGVDCGVTPISGCLDSDGDGLCDAWERAGGIDLNGDGIIDALLPGADPARKDVYLEIDYMVLPDQGTVCTATTDCNAGQSCTANICRGHSHRPHTEAIQAVVDAFARQGIALHLDPVQDAIPETPVVTFDALDAVCSGLPPTASNFYDLKARYSDPKRKSAYHYAIFGHYNTCGSGASCSLCNPSVSFGGGGRSELPGNDLIVSTGVFFDFGLTPAVEHEAGLLMHELGHNLGLRHGGDTDLPVFKPNYLSSTNDNFTFQGIAFTLTPGSAVPRSCTTSADCPSGICTSAGTCARIDYSRVALPTLDETHLDERAGIAAGTTDITTYVCPDFTPMSGAGTGPIDWNCNGNPTETDVSADVNADGSPPAFTSTTLLTGHADWPNLVYKFQCNAQGSANAPTPGRFVHEAGLSVEEARARHVLFARRAVQIELMPGVPVANKTISLGSSGEVAVTLFGADRFNVNDIDQTSLKFAGASPLRVEITDVNGDGKADLLLFFGVASLKLTGATGNATLSGWLANSQAFTGEVQMVVVP